MKQDPFLLQIRLISANFYPTTRPDVRLTSVTDTPRAVPGHSLVSRCLSNMLRPAQHGIVD